MGMIHIYVVDTARFGGESLVVRMSSVSLKNLVEMHLSVFRKTRDAYMVLCSPSPPVDSGARAKSMKCSHRTQEQTADSRPAI